jgi:hypothetical protein
MLTALIGPVAGLVTDWLQGQRDKSQAKHTAQMQVLSNTAIWEAKMADATNQSWKDEWFTILLSLPILAIIYGVVMNDPDIIDRVGLAFSQLNALPEWYQYLLYLAVFASFGIRGADKISQLLTKR